MYSRNTQKLMHWLFSDIACHLFGKQAGGKVSEFEMYKAKELIKKEYIKVVYEPKFAPLATFQDDVAVIVSDILDSDIETSEKVECIAEQITTLVIQELQKLMLIHGSFSTALKMLSQEGANKFVKFIFDYMLHNDIVMRKEIHELYSEQQDRNRIWALLYYKKCCICGKAVTFPHHVERSGKHGGYKHDKGDLAISPLCPECHSLVHTNIGEVGMKQKYELYSWIKLVPKEIVKIKKIYKGYATAFEEEIKRD